MLARKPLINIQNANVVPRKAKATYGRKGKATASLLAAKDIFAASHDLESQLAKLSVHEAEQSNKIFLEDDVVETGQTPLSCAKTIVTTKVNPEKTPSKQLDPIAPIRGQTTQTKPRSKRTACASTQTKKSKDEVESSSIEATNLTLNSSSDDQLAIRNFVKQYADRKVLSFERYGSTIAKRYDIKKVGEGTYSSVFSLTRREDVLPNLSQTRKTDLHQTTILKLIPILLPSQSNDDDDNSTMTPPIHIASEIETMRAMDPIHGFIRYRGCLVLHGSWASSFLEAFRDFAKTNRKKALNEDPEIAFTTNQYYAVIEMEDAGQELSDALTRPSMFQCWDVFWQTAIHHANAESVCGFEHRDLHVSNICVRADGNGSEMDVPGDLVRNMTEMPERLLGLSNIQLTIIDYTFSRVEVVNEKARQKVLYREFVPESKSYEQLCKEMARPKTSKSTADLEDRVQQLTYAKVAKMIDIAAETNGGDESESQHKWQRHVAKTNVAWLGYLVTCLLGRAGKTVKTKYVAGSSEVAKQVQDSLRVKLGELRDLLMVENLEHVLISAGEVVGIGVERDWLSVAELEDFRSRLEQDS